MTLCSAYIYLCTRMLFVVCLDRSDFEKHQQEELMQQKSKTDFHLVQSEIDKSRTVHTFKVAKHLNRGGPEIKKIMLWQRGQHDAFICWHFILQGVANSKWLSVYIQAAWKIRTRSVTPTKYQVKVWQLLRECNLSSMYCIYCMWWIEPIFLQRTSILTQISVWMCATGISTPTCIIPR